VPGRESPRALARLDPRDDLADLPGRLGLGDGQAVEPGVHRALDVVAEQGRIVVHAHEHLGAAPAGHGERITDERAGRGLLLRRDGVLEVEHDGVGAARVGLLDEAGDVHRQDQRRATGASHVR
jgi:hypothetical protein